MEIELKAHKIDGINTGPSVIVHVRVLVYPVQGLEDFEPFKWELEIPLHKDWRNRSVSEVRAQGLELAAKVVNMNSLSTLFGE
jgi:hypothetical protein